MHCDDDMVYNCVLYIATVVFEMAKAILTDLHLQTPVDFEFSSIVERAILCVMA